ncbi:unnamed protein product [Paramecium pentaurelia]|uniref:Uncharacterized protein n=1 Tax=Paramecium pentaurelia TaxID=43138 RepID=A0A8S1WSR2_9CILI|nr:unnamed protein product [Paramecium pentaurelia]
MGSGSSKQKADVSTNTETIQQKIQPIQAKPQELKKDDQTNKYNQAKPNNITYNKIVEIPKKDLPIVKATNQYDNSIQKKQINQDINMLQHRNLQKKEDQILQQRNDQQNIDYQFYNYGLINMKKNAPKKKMQQFLENIKIGNQRQQFNLNNNQENAGKSPFRAANLSFQADKDEKIKELNFKKLQQPIQNTFYNYQSPHLVGQKPIQKPGKNQYLPALFQEQQRKEEIKYKPQQNIKILEIIELDYIDIYNQIFNKKTQGRFSNQFPCKHSECKTVAHKLQLSQSYTLFLLKQDILN